MKKNKVYRLSLFDNDVLCSTVYADFTDKTVRAENHVENPIKTAFGNNFDPDWSDFQAFLRERCIPEERDGLKEYLKVLGLYEYDPLEIIRKTEGRMAEDNQWVRLEELS